MATLHKFQSLPETSDDMMERLQLSPTAFVIPIQRYPPIGAENSSNDCDISHFEAFIWDWPFSEDRMAKGFLSDEKFFVCLPFNQGGTGESRGTLKKFEKISESNFSWIIGLCNNSFFGTCFWRLEIEILRNLNMLVLNASRDVSRPGEIVKRLKRVRKVYKLPPHCDISTLTTKSYDWAVIIQANRKDDKLSGKNRPKILQRSVTIDN
uniref:Exostosin domain-containing protein n=1 Tax=Elaeophora elaphi TaxID=1147741 RepID=A0A0R3RG86_9BILA